MGSEKPGEETVRRLSRLGCHHILGSIDCRCSQKYGAVGIAYSLTNHILRSKETEMRILIAGSHGMVGSAVARHLTACGYEIFRLVRQTPGPCEVWWDPDKGEIDAAGLEGFEGVLHLATI